MSFLKELWADVKRDPLYYGVIYGLIAIMALGSIYMIFK